MIRRIAGYIFGILCIASFIAGFLAHGYFETIDYPHPIIDGFPNFYRIHPLRYLTVPLFILGGLLLIAFIIVHGEAERET